MLQKSQSKKKLRKLNTRCLVWTGYGFVSFVIFSIAIHLLHNHQVSRNADLYLRLANSAEQDGRRKQAISYLGRYIRFRPDDLEGLVRYATLLNEDTRSARSLQTAMLTFEIVLGSEPERHDIRLLTAKLALELQRFQDSLRHIRHLQKLEEPSAELEFLAGRSLEGAGEFTQAGVSYSKAISLKSNEIDYYMHLIDLVRLRSKDIDLKLIDPIQQEDAPVSTVLERLAESMVEQAEPKFQAYLARARARVNQEKLDQAAEDINKAMDLAGHEVVVLLQAAEIALLQAEEALYKADNELSDKLISQAGNHANRGLELEPPDIRFYLIKARVERMQNNYSQSLTTVQQGLEDFEKRRSQPGFSESRESDETERQLLFSLIDLLILEASLDPDHIDSIKLRVAKNRIAQLRETLMRKALIDFLDARIFFVEGRWHQASLLLERTRPKLDRFPTIMKRIDILLGLCYSELGNPDARLVVFRRVLESYPLWVPGRLGYADALASVNRLDESVQAYALLLGFPEVPEKLCRLALMDQLKRPETNRDWSLTTKILNIAEEQEPESVVIHTIRAQLLSVQGQFDEAEKLIAKLIDEHPEEPDVWTTLAGIKLRRSNLKTEERTVQAQKVLDRAKKKQGDLIDFRLIGTTIASLLPPEQALVALANLNENTGHFSKEEKVRLLRALAVAHGQIGAIDRAHSYWKQLAEIKPKDISTRLSLVAYASRVGEDEEIPRQLKAIREIEGLDGPNGNYVEASLLLNEVRRKRTIGKNITKARDLLKSAARQRPRWSAIYHALGILEDLANNPEEAFEHYQRSLNLGDRSKIVVFRVIHFLYQKQRYDEADQLLKSVAEEDSSLISGAIARLGWKIAWHKEQFDRALGLADDVAGESKDYRDLIWVSQLRYARGQRGVSVEQPLRESVKIAPDSPESWFALITYLVREDRIEEAQVTIRKASESLPERIKDTAIARCYELVNNLELAEKHYLQSMNRESKQIGPILILADFYTRNGDQKKAEPLLKKLIDPETQAPEFAVSWAKQRQAIRMASSRKYNDTGEALELLEQSFSSRKTRTLSEKKIQAEILATRLSQTDQREAIQLYEEILKSYPLSHAEQFQLARLYNDTNNWPKAREMLQTLLATSKDNRFILIFYISNLLERNDFLEAEIWIQQLENQLPDALLTVQFRSRIFAARGQTKAAAKILLDYFEEYQLKSPEKTFAELVDQGNVDDAFEFLELYLKKEKDDSASIALSEARNLMKKGKPEKALARLSYLIDLKSLITDLQAKGVHSVALLLEEFGEFASAEKMYLEHISRTNKAHAYLDYAAFLARRGQVDKALDLCEQTWNEQSSHAVARATIGILELLPNDAEVAKRVKSQLLDAVKRNPNSSWEMLALARLYELQNQPSSAESLYRKVISFEQNNIWALNNLAWLLSLEKRNLQEALGFVNRVIDIVGPIPHHLDTRAMVYFAQKNYAAAIVDLKQAIDENPATTLYFHLALANWQAGNRTTALVALNKAQELGFDEKLISLSERRLYKELVSAINQK